jgi:hypothetical protein
MMKFKLLLLSLLLLINVLTAFSSENTDNNIKDTLNITPVDTLAIKDTISVIPVDTLSAEAEQLAGPNSESLERKGFHFLWVMIGLLLVLAFMGFRIKHKN